MVKRSSCPMGEEPERQRDSAVYIFFSSWRRRQRHRSCRRRLCESRQRQVLFFCLLDQLRQSHDGVRGNESIPAPYLRTRAHTWRWRVWVEATATTLSELLTTLMTQRFSLRSETIHVRKSTSIRINSQDTRVLTMKMRHFAWYGAFLR